MIQLLAGASNHRCFAIAEALEQRRLLTGGPTPFDPCFDELGNPIPGCECNCGGGDDGGGGTNPGGPGDPGGGGGGDPGDGPGDGGDPPTPPHAHRGSVSTVAACLRELGGLRHPYFASLSDYVENPDGKWFNLKDAPLDALLVMEEVIAEMQRDFPETAARVAWWFRPTLAHDLEVLRPMVAARIARVRRHGSLESPTGTLAFGRHLFWESSVERAAAVIQYLKRHSERPDLSRCLDVFERAPRTTWRFELLPADALKAMGELVASMHQELENVLPELSVDEHDAFEKELNVLHEVIGAGVEWRRANSPPPPRPVPMRNKEAYARLRKE